MFCYQIRNVCNLSASVALESVMLTAICTVHICILEIQMRGTKMGVILQKQNKSFVRICYEVCMCHTSHA